MRESSCRQKANATHIPPFNSNGTHTRTCFPRPPSKQQRSVKNESSFTGCLLRCPPTMGCLRGAQHLREKLLFATAVRNAQLARAATRGKH